MEEKKFECDQLCRRRAEAHAIFLLAPPDRNFISRSEFMPNSLIMTRPHMEMHRPGDSQEAFLALLEEPEVVTRYTCKNGWELARGAPSIISVDAILNDTDLMTTFGDS